MKFVNVILISCVTFLYSCSKTNYSVISPNGKIKAEIYSENNKLFYKVLLNDSLLIGESPLGIKLKDSAFDFTLISKINEAMRDSINEPYTLTTGKRKKCINYANQLTLKVENVSGKTMNLIFRAYNDGVGYRYVLSNEKEDIVSDEISGFNIPSGSYAWATPYRIDNEGYYLRQSTDTMKSAIYGMPLLVETPNKKYVLFHEADVLSSYCASSLQGNKGDNIFSINLRYPKYTTSNPEHSSPWEKILVEENSEIIAKPNLQTPWRVMVIGNSLKPIVESTLVESLSSPPANDDHSWINPGVAVFPWWGNNHANGDSTVLKSYIDMAAAMNWKYIEFDVSLVGSPDFAIEKWKTTPWINRVVKYAASKGISVYGWDERRNLNTPEKRADIFGRYRDLGIKGIKIDFINSLNQEAMAFREACLRDALKYNLLVSFHGDYQPRGERRTYPNIATHEGVKGSEYYLFMNPNEVPTPAHNCTLPFTRNVIGPMDYTPVAFSEKSRITTYAHELALSVVVESGWLCMCDKPEMYLNSNAIDFLKKLVSVWDETLYLGGFPGEYFCIARRNGTDWFVVGINAGKQRTVKMNCDFLANHAKSVKLYCDGENARNECLVKEISIEKNTPIEISLAENGGFAMCISEDNFTK